MHKTDSSSWWYRGHHGVVRKVCDCICGHFELQQKQSMVKLDWESSYSITKCNLQ